MRTPAPLTVLVVDDEQRSLETLRRTLEDDFTVYTAQSAEDGEAIMAREFVHIVLSLRIHVKITDAVGRKAGACDHLNLGGDDAASIVISAFIFVMEAMALAGHQHVIVTVGARLSTKTPATTGDA